MTRRISQLLVGLFGYGMALAFMVHAGIGLSPWDVLGDGAASQTGIAFGWVSNIIGAIILLLWIPIRQKPGIGTVANVLLVGTSAQFGLWLLPEPSQLVPRILFFAGGLLLLAASTGLYIGANFGPGPRDGLMTGLVARTGWPIWVVRTGIEAAVFLTGWLLGGDVGVGTVVFVLAIGPLCQLFMPLFAIPPRPRKPEIAELATCPEPGES
ncbi:hypothetical protein LWF01_09795 [Saxibacter everestensis]|uniref:Membrane protein YczE n=1 Tax=Saxibacter everestensis TaxID=2909229 RepID=A0ABY8QN93_9MICO|nr:hypothetical protein LWF01_09795 [Brevibacteriaceae bacterium ZFBP1038]